MNCPVFAPDVRNTDAANKGVSVAGLLGKTAKKGSISPGYVLAPRVTRVYQILDVDVIFKNNIAFLLSVFTPLGLGLVQFLRSRRGARQKRLRDNVQSRTDILRMIFFWHF